MTNKPPVTDFLPIAIRAYAVPTWQKPRDVQDRSKKPGRTPMPASPWTLIFDTETTTDASQALRFGTFQLREEGQLRDAGIFFDPEGIEPFELTLLRQHAADHGLSLRSRSEFVDEVFFARAYQLRATIVGFNLPFDISRLAISHGSARAPLKDDANAMRGAFTFKLSGQKIYPNIRVKHLSSKAALIAFAAPMGQRDSRGQRNRGFKTGARRGHFIDVKTISNALFAKSFSLSSLSKFLEIRNPKLSFDEFDATITEAGDVQATWECYSELAKRYAALNLNQTNPEKIYSEAGIGKAYLKEMRIAPWREVQPDFPSDLLAKIMGSYFGGRSEVRIRREVRQVILCDFLSMYPTVCALVNLWQYVIADGIDWTDATEEARNLLERADATTLQSNDAWRQLAVLVRVLPDADIFPVRAAYSDEPQSTIGANYLSSDTPLWFTLADCIAARLLGGKSPQIIEAISFAPRAMQAGLRPIDIAGNAAYRVDPTKTDFFKGVIELRQSLKTRMKHATDDERMRLDTEQNALKICANSTSYGIYVETNVEARPKTKSVTIYSSACEPFSFDTDKTEMPGKYFHPLLATLITGAARLMLALAERLATDRGLDWTFCDTDSMAFAKPEEMDSGQFGEAVQTIVDWFGALNPYDFGGSILKVEEVNSSLTTSAAQPLYCLAISSKRYALFNLTDEGRPVMRKVSAHGLGHLRAPYGETDAPPDLPVPDKSVLKDGTVRWHCDLWYQIVTATLAGHPDQVSRDYHPALSLPAVSRYAATSPELLAWFKSYNADRSYREQVKPFGFLLSLSPCWELDSADNGTLSSNGRRRKKANSVKPIAPFDLDHEKAVAAAFDRATGKLVSAKSLRTYADALAQYHISPESKFLNGDYLNRGVTGRRHVRMVTAVHIGKEAHDWERQATIGLNRTSEIGYGPSPSLITLQLKHLINEFGEKAARRALDIPLSRWRPLVATSTHLQSASAMREITKRLPNARQKLERECDARKVAFQRLIEAVEADGLRPTARRLGVDPSNLGRKLRRPPT